MATTNYENPLGTSEIFANAHEKFLKTTIIYNHQTVDNYAYWDENCEEKISSEDLLNLFVKGVCVFEKSAGVFFKPSACTVTDGVVGFFAYNPADEDSAPMVVYSAEYVESQT